MKIKLKSLNLESTTGELLQANTGSSGSAYQTAGNGSDVSEIYFQDKTGVIGGVRLGVEHNVWIPYSALPSGITPTNEDKLLISGTEYKLRDIQNKVYSDFEDHYEINIYNENE